MYILKKFGLLIRWFGPLKQVVKDEETNIVSIISRVMQEPWFHGDVPRPNAESLLTDYIKKKRNIYCSFIYN